MKLVQESAVRSLLRFDQMARTDAAITAALTLATVQLEAKLRTSFAAGVGVEIFYLRTMNHVRAGMVSRDGYATHGWRQKLALKDGFLSAAPTLHWARSVAELTDAPQPFQAGETLVDLVRGEVVIEGPDLRGHYVRASYAHGFAVDQTDPALYSQTQAPQWLKDAALAYATQALLAANPDLAGEDTQKNVAPLVAAADEVVTRHMRYFPAALRPLV